MALHLAAADWPEWMGTGRDGVWSETGLVESFTAESLPVKWKVPVRAGYVGPAVADGRVFLLDREAGVAPERKRGDKSLPQIPGKERVLCLDAATGKTLWERVYDVGYRISYPGGPRATPLVRDGRVFTLGAMGDLQCLEAASGKVVWSTNVAAAHGTEPPVWGYAAHPLLLGESLVVPVGGAGSAVVAFDRHTGRELWKSGTAVEIGYAPPVVAEVAGRRQIVFWHADGIAGLDPSTGAELWTHPYPVGGRPQRPEVTIALPRISGDTLFLTSFYQGSMLVRVPRSGEAAKTLWNRRSRKQSEMTEGLHTVMSTPVVRDGHVYGICAFGELRCLDLRTGDRLWESLELFHGESGFFAHAFMVEQADRCWFWTDKGELVLGRLSPKGLEVLSRARLLEPIENTRGRDVLWCHPAFANRCLYVHNGREFLCVDLSYQG